MREAHRESSWNRYTGSSGSPNFRRRYDIYWSKLPFVRNSSLTSSKGTSFPIQESRKTAAAAATPTIQKMGTEMGTKVGTEAPQIKDKDNEEIFLVLPSYAEPFSRKIRQIILAEKQKMCKHKKYNAIFSSIKIRLAYTNNKNIKHQKTRIRTTWPFMAINQKIWCLGFLVVLKGNSTKHRFI